MNFIIAVVGDSYRKTMDRKTEHMIKVRLDMVLERESLMTEKEFANEEWFPNYIIFRKDPHEDKEKDLLTSIQTQI